MTTKLTDDEERAYMAARGAINAFDTLLITLLTQGTALIFGALALALANRADLGDALVFWITAGLSIGTGFVFVGVVLYSTLLYTAVTAAKQFERALPASAKITARLDNAHRLAGGRLGLWYYRSWSAGLTGASLAVTVWSLIEWKCT